ncbi:type VI secretion system protein ImpM [Variovorax sp. OK605]|jgi:type VI secretion system protein ImpM|uniref:type VI secretion system-associated protein TagF n=1 Tax=Variovorax sp. OK605 TaxID=1855317 RepID=UPI0008E17601|nr:type VI secretion system-associated protein TagF [Variovorax sp. OK605]SFO52046.1 type VI secretion system protein ImpM [Variovorax sp. OK605]
MWPRWIDGWRITAPAIWGKLPDHADFVRSGVRHGELEAWAGWLDEQSHSAGVDASAKAVALPAAFVLPPGTLAFARRRFVLGVIAPSIDRVGRHHPLVVYQKAQPRWVLRHFEAQLRQPCDWQFWLARAVARHTQVEGRANLAAMEGTVKALWRAQAGVLGARRSDDAEAEQVQQARQARQAQQVQQAHRAVCLLDHWAGPSLQDDLGARLHGVRYLPWSDWPQRLSDARAESAFWQQDAQGRFVGAANCLQKLWGGMP